MRVTEEQLEQAREQGRGAAKAAASWTTDGNTSQDHIRRMLAWLDDGDPRADDYLPNYPNLSGEWADDPTPLSLARDITGLEDPSAEEQDSLAEAFDDGVSEVFMSACEAQLRSASDAN